MKITASRFNGSQWLLRVAIGFVLLLNIFIFMKLTGSLSCSSPNVAQAQTAPRPTLPVHTLADETCSSTVLHWVHSLLPSF